MPGSERVVIGVRVQPVEALMTRSSGEFSLGAWVSGSPVMLPTTLAGALGHAGWCLDATCSENRGRWDAMRECVATLVRERLNLPVRGATLSMRGPALLIEGKLYVPTVRGLVEVSPEGITDWVRRQLKGEVPGKRAGDVKHNFIRLEELMLARTCVGLNRESKVSKTTLEGAGLLYTAPYTYYVFRSGSKDRGKLLRASIVTDILVSSNGNITLGNARFPIRLGGEGRKAMAEISTKKPALINKIQELWEGRNTEHTLLILATPMILNASRTKPRTHEDVKMIVLKTLRESLEGIMGIETNEVLSIHPNIRPQIVPLQLGYDEARRRKGRIKPAIMPGAVFRVKLSKDMDWKEIYTRGAGPHNEVGFGTLIPIPYTE